MTINNESKGNLQFTNGQATANLANVDIDRDGRITQTDIDEVVKIIMKK